MTAVLAERPMTASKGRSGGQGALARGWRGHLVRLATLAALMLALFLSDWAAMARQWWNISTYNHILLIPPILSWLVSQRRAELARIAPVTWWPGLLIMAGAGGLWLLGAVSGLDLARHAGAVGLLGALVPLLLGPRVAAGLAFPLACMAFLVPFGDELVPILQTVTARIVVVLVHTSRIPAVVDGVFIDTPAGLFEVAQACAGVSFLIATVALGAVMANVCFVSTSRRAMLLAACVVVPVVANGVRAWGTIYAAQYFGIAAAAGFDHIVYGWVFFALVLALIIAGAWRFFDRPLDAPMIDAEAILADGRLSRLSAMTMPAGAAIVMALAGALALQGWAMLAERVVAPVPARIDLPEVAGFRRVDYAPRLWWEPRAGGADHRLLGSYADAEGRRIEVFYALYAGQGEGRDAGAFGEGALVPDSPWAWLGEGPAIGGGRGERMLGAARVQRLAVTWYRSGEALTGDRTRLKLSVMADRLRLRATPTATLIISAEDSPGGPAGASVRAFVRAVGPMDAWIDRIGGVR